MQQHEKVKCLHNWAKSTLYKVYRVQIARFKLQINTDYVHTMAIELL